MKSKNIPMLSILSLAMLAGSGTVLAESDGPGSLSGDSGVGSAPAVSTGRVQGNYDGYVDSHSDLAAAFAAYGGHMSKSDWGEAHYGAFGRYEGRSLSGSGQHNDRDDDHHNNHVDNHNDNHVDDHDDDHHNNHDDDDHHDDDHVDNHNDNHVDHHDDDHDDDHHDHDDDHDDDHHDDDHDDHHDDD